MTILYCLKHKRSKHIKPGKLLSKAKFIFDPFQDILKKDYVREAAKKKVPPIVAGQLRGGGGYRPGH